MQFQPNQCKNSLYPFVPVKMIAVRKSDALKKREYKAVYNTGLGFGIVETYGCDTFAQE